MMTCLVLITRTEWRISKCILSVTHASAIYFVKREKYSASIVQSTSERRTVWFKCLVPSTEILILEYHNTELARFNFNPKHLKQEKNHNLQMVSG